jgi:dipeptidase E
MARRLLLISTSTVFGTRYLEHAFGSLRDTLDGVRRVLFIPFALKDRDAYTAKAREAFAELGFELDSLHEAADPRGAVAQAEAVFCGGGNTFRLLKTLCELGVMPLLRERALGGMPYAGASAGSNLACPTIRTTNDMPIVQPPTLDALALVPFQINPHYLDPEPGSTHMGETREQRLAEFLEENDRVVVGLREGGWIRVDGPRGELGGRRGARVFRRGAAPEERAPGATIGDLLAG